MHCRIVVNGNVHQLTVSQAGVLHHAGCVVLRHWLLVNVPVVIKVKAVHTFCVRQTVRVRVHV